MLEGVEICYRGAILQSNTVVSDVLLEHWLKDIVEAICAMIMMRMSIEATKSLQEEPW